MIEPLMEPLLRLPGMRDDARWLPLLSPLEIDAGLRPMSVTPRGLNEHVPTMTVPRLRDRSESPAIAARVFARDQPEVAGQLSGVLDATPVDDLRHEHHRRMEGEATEALQAPDHRGERGQEGERLDLAIELVASLELVEQEGVLLPEDEAIGRRER
jgi:hypothetical protein